MSRQPYTLPTKCCADCFAVLPTACFPWRKHSTKPAYLESTCLECTRRRWRAYQARKRAMHGVPGRVFVQVRRIRKAPPKPSYTPPVDFLPMGDPDRTVPLRWAL